MRMFDALLKVVSTLFGPLTIEKCIEHPHFIFCSTFQNLRLGSIILPLPNEDFGRPDELFVDLSECVFEALFNGVST